MVHQHGYATPFVTADLALRRLASFSGQASAFFQFRSSVHRGQTLVRTNIREILGSFTRGNEEAHGGADLRT